MDETTAAKAKAKQEKAKRLLDHSGTLSISQVYDLNIDPHSKCVITGNQLLRLFNLASFAYVEEGNITELVHDVNCIGSQKIGYTREAFLNAQG